MRLTIEPTEDQSAYARQPESMHHSVSIEIACDGLPADEVAHHLYQLMVAYSYHPQCVAVAFAGVAEETGLLGEEQ